MSHAVGGRVDSLTPGGRLLKINEFKTKNKKKKKCASNGQHTNNLKGKVFVGTQTRQETTFGANNQTKKNISVKRFTLFLVVAPFLIYEKKKNFLEQWFFYSDMRLVMKRSKDFRKPKDFMICVLL